MVVYLVQANQLLYKAILITSDVIRLTCTLSFKHQSCIPYSFPHVVANFQIRTIKNPLESCWQTNLYIQGTSRSIKLSAHQAKLQTYYKKVTGLESDQPVQSAILVIWYSSRYSPVIKTDIEIKVKIPFIIILIEHHQVAAFNIIVFIPVTVILEEF